MGNCLRFRTTSRRDGGCFCSRSDDNVSFQPNDNSESTQRNIPIFSIHGYRYSTLHTAAMKGDTEKVNHLLEQECFDYDQHSHCQNTPFSLAAQEGHLEVFEILLKRGVNVHNSDHELDTPMHYAAMNKSITMVKQLIDYGAEVNVENKYGTTPLWMAAYHGDAVLLKLLLYHNADASMSVCATGARLVTRYGSVYDRPRSPLYVAVDKCAEDCVSVLISAGCDLSKEKWLQEGDYPTREKDEKRNEKDDEIISIQRSVSLLTQKASRPQSLLFVCRTFLRRRLGRKLTGLVTNLEVPNSLKNFLTFADFAESVTWVNRNRRSIKGLVRSEPL